MSYDPLKYNDERWIKKREEILIRDNRLCFYDKTHTGVMQVHHVYYIPNTDPWDYPDDALKTVCRTCNYNERFWKIEVNSILRELTSKQGYSYDQLYSYLSGLVGLLSINNELRCELGGLSAGREDTLEFTRNYINNILGSEIIKNG